MSDFNGTSSDIENIDRMEIQIEWHEQLGSTNTYIRDCFIKHSLIKSGFIAAAREQTSGRGRQDRPWLSAPNSNLCFSLFWEIEAPLLIQIPSLSMAVALAVTEFLNVRNIHATPKWPNDVLVGTRKICGILSEHVQQKDRQGIVIGVGLNVNMTQEQAAAIDRPATSMLIESGQTSDPERILKELLPTMEFWIDRWEGGGFAAIRDTWTEKAGPICKPLSVHDGDIRKNGRLAGFGEHGELLLETEAGIETIWAGDVS